MQDQKDGSSIITIMLVFFFSLRLGDQTTALPVSVDPAANRRGRSQKKKKTHIVGPALRAEDERKLLGMRCKGRATFCEQKVQTDASFAEKREAGVGRYLVVQAVVHGAVQRR